MCLCTSDAEHLFETHTHTKFSSKYLMTLIQKDYQGVSRLSDSKCEKASCATYKPFDALKSEVFGFWMISEAFWFAVLP